MDRKAIMGDVHGQLNQLKQLFDYLDTAYPGIEIYSTGDLIDRGPDSKGVVNLCIKRQVKAVRGNHDDTLIRYIKSEVGALHCHLNPGMGGLITAHSYGIKSPTTFNDIFDQYKKLIPDEHKRYLCDLPLYRIIKSNGKKYFLNHAGLAQTDWDFILKEHYDDDNNQKINAAMDTFEDSILWVHKGGGFARIFNMKQIVGHKPVAHAILSDDFYMVDTGCGKPNGILSCLILPDHKVIEVSENHVYELKDIKK